MLQSDTLWRREAVQVYFVMALYRYYYTNEEVKAEYLIRQAARLARQLLKHRG